jgi:hypothetical protein
MAWGFTGAAEPDVNVRAAVVPVADDVTEAIAQGGQIVSGNVRIQWINVINDAQQEEGVRVTDTAGNPILPMVKVPERDNREKEWPFPKYNGVVVWRPLSGAVANGAVTVDLTGYAVT